MPGRQAFHSLSVAPQTNKHVTLPNSHCHDRQNTHRQSNPPRCRVYTAPMWHRPDRGVFQAFWVETARAFYSNTAQWNSQKIPLPTVAFPGNAWKITFSRVVNKTNPKWSRAQSFCKTTKICKGSVLRSFVWIFTNRKNWEWERLEAYTWQAIN